MPKSIKCRTTHQEINQKGVTVNNYYIFIMIAVRAYSIVERVEVVETSCAEWKSAILAVVLYPLVAGVKVDLGIGV